jgi:hypothetical protein
MIWRCPLLFLLVTLCSSATDAISQPRLLSLGCSRDVVVTSMASVTQGVVVGGSWSSDQGPGGHGGQGGTDAFLACFDEQLQLRWVQFYGGVGNDRVEAVTALQDGTGDVVVAMTMAANTASITSYTIGAVTLGGRGNTDAVIARFSSSGDVVWVRNDGGTSYEIPTHVVSRPDGSVIVCGFFGQRSRFGFTTVQSPSSQCAYLQLLDASGNHQGVVTSEISSARDQVSWIPLMTPDGQLAIVSSATAEYTIASSSIPPPETSSTRIVTLNDNLDVDRVEEQLGCEQWTWSSDGTYAGIGITDVCDPRLLNQLLMGSVQHSELIRLGLAGEESVLQRVYSSGDGIVLAGVTASSVVVAQGDRDVVLDADAFIVQVDRQGTYLHSLEVDGMNAAVGAVVGSAQHVVAGITVDGSVTCRSARDGVPAALDVQCPSTVLISWQDGPTHIDETSASSPRWLEHLPIDVYTLQGRYVSQVNAHTFDRLPVGMVLVLRQGHRVSLCYASSSEHISFSVPPASTR